MTSNIILITGIPILLTGMVNIVLYRLLSIRSNVDSLPKGHLNLIFDEKSLKGEHELAKQMQRLIEKS